MKQYLIYLLFFAGLLVLSSANSQESVTAELLRKNAQLLTSTAWSCPFPDEEEEEFVIQSVFIFFPDESGMRGWSILKMLVRSEAIDFDIKAMGNWEMKTPKSFTDGLDLLSTDNMVYDEEYLTYAEALYMVSEAETGFLLDVLGPDWDEPSEIITLTKDKLVLDLDDAEFLICKAIGRSDVNSDFGMKVLDRRR